MILGCGRSGTSIFGELFEALPGYEYQSEPSFDAVMAADFRRPRAFKVPRESKAFPARPGLSFPLDVFLMRAPDAAIFWIVRHPLDAVCSLRVGIARNWGHHPRPPDWRDWLEAPLLEQCSRHWAFVNSEGYRQVRDRCEVVKFEDMIADPESFAISVCQIVGLDPASAKNELKTWAARVQDSNNEAFVEARTSRPYSRADHERRVGRWRENLTDEDIATVWACVAPVAEQFGYRRAG
jgi:hypothetical protein